MSISFLAHSIIIDFEKAAVKLKDKVLSDMAIMCSPKATNID